MANIGNHEIFFGAVISERQEDVLPSWFLQNVNPVNDLKTYFGADASDIFVDVCAKLTNGAYMYFRCYCDTADALRINRLPSSGSLSSHLYLTHINSEPKICNRTIEYTNAGNINTHSSNDWSTNQLLLTYMYARVGVLYKGHSFCVSDGSDWAQWVY